MFETAFVMSGLAWQQELHYKEVNDRVNDTQTILAGNYVQLGYFFSELFDSIPPELEFAVRHAILDPDRNADVDLQQEAAVAANWFFNGHRNKLTASVTWLDCQVTVDEMSEEWRIQLQWDVSL